MQSPDHLDKFYRGRAVLITGGLGFIGSNLAAALVALGARVTLIDSLIPEFGGNLHNIAGIADRVRVNISDVRDRHSMPIFVRDQAVLFNLAGQTSHVDSMTDPGTDLEINARAQLSILEACRKYNPAIRIVFASTRQLYGRPDYLPVDEKHPLRPIDVNGINKLAGEQYHLLYDRVHDIAASVLRLTNTIGPHMRIKDARQTFLGVWIGALLKGEAFEVWGGNQQRDFTYVDDVVDAFLRSGADSASDGQVFNLGGCPPVSLRVLAEMLIEVFGGGQFVMRDYPAHRQRIDIGDYYADDRAIRAALGWAPRTDLRMALAKTVAYYRAEGSHYL